MVKGNMAGGRNSDLVADLEAIGMALGCSPSWEGYDGADGMADTHCLPLVNNWEAGTGRHRMVDWIEEHDLD